MIDFNKYFIVGTNSNALHDTMNGIVIGELIRCKDCRWWWEGMRVCALKEHLVDGVCAVVCMEDDFCSRAERKETS